MRLDYAVHVCTICMKPNITIGDQKFGGVRYCADCLPNTFLWRRCTLKEQFEIVTTFERLKDKKEIRQHIRQMRHNSVESRQHYISLEKALRYNTERGKE